MLSKYINLQSFYKKIKQPNKFIILKDGHPAARDTLLWISSLLLGPLDFVKDALIYQLLLLFELNNMSDL